MFCSSSLERARDGQIGENYRVNVGDFLISLSDWFRVSLRLDNCATVVAMSQASAWRQMYLECEGESLMGYGSQLRTGSVICLTFPLYPLANEQLSQQSRRQASSRGREGEPTWGRRVLFTWTRVVIDIASPSFV